MERNNFYVSKLGTTTDLFFGYSWSSGSFESTSNMKVGATSAIRVKSCSRFRQEVTISGCTYVKIYDIDEEKKVIRSRMNPGIKIDIPINSDVYYIAIELGFNSEHSRWVSIDYEVLRLVNPYYKSIKNQYKKESGQMFFRESINGTITLRGSDYEYVNNISIEDNVGFYIYRDGALYAVNEFNKTDCKINHSNCSVELKLKPKDKYEKILNDYDKTHDLLKLPIAKTYVELTKRCAIQLYFQGDNTITNYAGGTYWEDEVVQAIDDAAALRDKYYFTQAIRFGEINLSGFNYDRLNTTFKMNPGQTIWNGLKNASIVFTKIASKGDAFEFGYNSEGVLREPRWLSDPLGEIPFDDYPAYYYKNGSNRYSQDAYRIEIYNGINGTGQRLYQSFRPFLNDTNFMLQLTPQDIFIGGYYMIAVSQNVPYKDPEPAGFNLGEKAYLLSLWGRLLCDVDMSSDGTVTYDLPYDDFATKRANFNKCIGLNFKSDNNMDLIHFSQSNVTQDEPTPFGINDSGKYFVAPRIYGSVAYELYPYPFAKSSWGNTSLWVGFEENENLSLPALENFRKKFYKAITHKDCMEIGSVIKALLEKIDSTIKFDSSPSYSKFLYGSVNNSVGESGQRIYITQKSNVLNGEYDQAAQKGEITFGQVMNMLKNCFRCYWYIDSERRFRIEHIRYFMNGLSYSEPDVQYDLTKKYDKFNNKSVLHGQDEISFSKAELKSRYEFAWSNDTTEMMGGGFYVDVKSNYIEQGSKESVNIDLFTPDIDFMMFEPERFSQDGFALLVTDSNNRVPIEYATAHNQQNPGVEMTNYVQNYYASFLHLFNNYLYDMPARNIVSSADYINGDRKYYVRGVKKFVQQNIRFQPGDEPDLHKLIVTSQGEGSIDSMSIDIDNGMVEATLLYSIN